MPGEYKLHNVGKNSTGPLIVNQSFDRGARDEDETANFIYSRRIGGVDDDGSHFGGLPCFAPAFTRPQIQSIGLSLGEWTAVSLSLRL